MRIMLAVAIVLVGACNKDREKDAEIARLKAQLAAQKPAPTPPAPNPQPETVPPPATSGTPTPPPPPTASGQTDQDVGRAMGDRLLAGTLTADDMKILLREAERNKAITYAHLMKNADKYKNDPWRLRGRLIQINESNDGITTGQIALDEWGNQLMHFEGKLSTDFVENNVVEILGVLEGSYSYTAINGWEMTVPQILVAAMTKRGGLDKIAGKKQLRDENDIDRELRRQGLQRVPE